jgi:hypothetical protein
MMHINGIRECTGVAHSYWRLNRKIEMQFDAFEYKFKISVKKIITLIDVFVQIHQSE